MIYRRNDLLRSIVVPAHIPKRNRFAKSKQYDPKRLGIILPSSIRNPEERRYKELSKMIKLLFSCLFIFFLICDTHAKNAPQRIFHEDQAQIPQEKSYQKYIQTVKKAIELSDHNICRQSNGYRYQGDDFIETNSQVEAENSCYFEYSRQKLDIYVCERISSKNLLKLRKHMADELFDACFYEVQKSMASFSEDNCRKMKNKDGWYFSECIQQVVKKIRDARLCDQYFEKYTGHWHGCKSMVKK